MNTPVLTATKTGAAIGAGIALFGAIDHQALIAWGGFALTAASGLATFVWSQYHVFRETRRNEDVADRKAITDSIRQQVEAQVELAHRVHDSAEKVGGIERTALTLADKVDGIERIAATLAEKVDSVNRGIERAAATLAEKVDGIERTAATLAEKVGGIERTAATLAEKVGGVSRGVADLVELLKRERCPFAEGGVARCQGSDFPKP